MTMLGDIARTAAPAPCTAAAPSARVRQADVLAYVARHFGMERSMMLDKDRQSRFDTARQLAMYLTRALTDGSFPQIGVTFGGRDHTTVMAACRAVQHRMAASPAYTALVNRLAAEILARAANRAEINRLQFGRNA